MASAGVTLWTVSVPCRIRQITAVSATPKTSMAPPPNETLPSLDQMQRVWSVSLRRPLEDPKPVKPAVSQQPARPPPPPKPPPPSFELVGIYMGPKVSYAMLRRGAAPTSQVSEGQTVDGWTIESIRGDHVILRQGQTTETVRLKQSSILIPGVKVSKLPAYRDHD